MFKHRFYIYLTIILLMMLPLISIDICLPALPNIQHFFDAQKASVQLTLTLYLFGYGIGQLIYAPFVEKYGAKLLLLIGLLIYMISTGIIIFSNNVHTLALIRLFQGVGACSGSVIGRIIILDIFQDEAPRAFSAIYPFVGSSPIIAPLLGGYLTDYFGGWVSTFVALLFVGFLIIFLVLKNVPAHEKKTQCMSTHSFIKAYSATIKNSRYWRYASLFIGQYQIWFVYIIETPFLFHRLGLDAREIGFLYIPLSATFFIVNQVVRKLLKRYTPDHLLLVGLIFVGLGALCWLLPLQASWVGVLQIVAPMLIIMIGCSALAPLGTAGALEAVKEKRAYASALLGFFQLSSGAMITFMLTHFSHASYYLLAFIGLLAFFVLLLLFVVLGNNRLVDSC